MRAKLLIVLVMALLVACAMPALCGKPAGSPAANSSLDGALSARWFPYSNTKDIITIAMQEMELAGLTDDVTGWGKKLKKAVAVEPVFVKSLDATYPDYYIVSFVEAGKISVMAIVGVKGKQAEFMEGHSFDAMDSFPPVTEPEAKIHAKAVGRNVDGLKGQLVFKFSKQCPGAALPVWDFGNGVRVSQKGEAFSEFSPEPKLSDPERQ